MNQSDESPKARYIFGGVNGNKIEVPSKILPDVVRILNTYNIVNFRIGPGPEEGCFYLFNVDSSSPFQKSIVEALRQSKIIDP